MKIKKISVLTSGGDAQGMNCAIAVLTKLCKARGIDLYGVVEGYKGLYNNDYVKLDLDKVSNIETLGGTILKTSRFLEFKQEEILDKCVQNIKKARFDAVIVIGGDGSFTGALTLLKKGVKVLCIPATVDNDLRYTDKCLGFDSAVNNSSSYISSVQQTMSALNRGVVFEVMGRYCGDIALHSACATSCDIIAVPEKPTSEEEIISKALSVIKNQNRMPTIVVAEKLFDVPTLADRLSAVSGKEFKYSIVGYLQRGGAPSVADRTLAMLYAVKVIELIEKGIFNEAVGLNGRKIFSLPIEECLSSEYNFDYELLNLFYSLNSSK